MTDLKQLQKTATSIRKKIVQMTHKAGASHVGSALSCADIITALYFDAMKIDPKNPGDGNRDRFILSKGHAGAALYAALIERGFFPESLLEGFHTDNGRIWGHPTIGCTPGVEATTGSLGHGFPLGIGMALTGRLDSKDYRVFVLMGDGECDEGSNWEAALSAAHHKLDNLAIIIDYNKLQCFGRTYEVLELEPLAEKWKAFGFSTKEVNGHDLEELVTAFKVVPFEKGKPSAIIANTVKGKGVSFMEDKLEWHYKSANKEQARQACEELDRQAFDNKASNGETGQANT